jgi:hypothetical protein
MRLLCVHRTLWQYLNKLQYVTVWVVHNNINKQQTFCLNDAKRFDVSSKRYSSGISHVTPYNVISNIKFLISNRPWPLCVFYVRRIKYMILERSKNNW